jgi:hypothetical protein
MNCIAVRAYLRKEAPERCADLAPRRNAPHDPSIPFTQEGCVMRGSLPAHVSVILVLLGWSVVAAVRERLVIQAHPVIPSQPRDPLASASRATDPTASAERRDPAWMWIN